MPEPAVDSPRNPRVRAAAALRERRARDETGLTLVDGGRELARAVEGGAPVVEVFVERGRELDGEVVQAVAGAEASGAKIVEVSARVARHLGYGDRNEGVVAVVRVPDRSLGALRLPPDPLLVVVEGVEKPGNLGAILRSADAAGADAVLAADPRTDPFNPNAIRASLGTIFAIPLAASSTAEAREFLRAAGIRAIAARPDGPVVYTDVDLRGPLAIVLGSEAAGLSDAWGGSDVAAVRLPMLGVADSLNVSVAAAVLLYEARRQRSGS